MKSENYVYKNGKSKVELIISNGKDYLIYDTPIKVNFKWTNIDVKTGMINGVGIKIIDSKDNFTKTEINVPSNYFKEDTLNIKVQFKKGEELIKTVFKLPIIKS